MIEYDNGAPMHWRNETSGKMKEAVEAYWKPIADSLPSEELPELSNKHIFILRLYILHWAKCPGFRNNPHADKEDHRKLDEAIALVENIETRSDISRALDVLMDLCIDPF